jgi:hypothetical protein
MRDSSLESQTGEKTLCCPECRKPILGVWHADPIEGIRFYLARGEHEHDRYRHWLEANPPNTRQRNDLKPRLH